MTKRSVEEILQDIQTTQEKHRDILKENFCEKTMGWRNSGCVTELNRLSRRIDNLKLELDRAKQRDWK